MTECISVCRWNMCKDYGSDSAIQENLLTYSYMQHISRLASAFACYRKEWDRCLSCNLYQFNPKQAFWSGGRIWNRLRDLWSHQYDFKQFVSVATKALLLNSYLLVVWNDLTAVSLMKSCLLHLYQLVSSLPMQAPGLDKHDEVELPMFCNHIVVSLSHHSL